MKIDVIPYRHRLRLWWLIGFLVIAWSLWQTIFTTGSPMSAYGNLGDEALMSQSAERIIHGQVPHRDFYSYVPGTAYYPLAGWFLLFGDQYIVVRIFSWVTAFAICLCLWWIARRLSSWGAIIPALLFAIIVFPFWPFASYHWMFMLLALISTGFLVDSPSRRRWMYAGICLGLSFLILPNKALLLLAAQLLSFLAWRKQTDFRISFQRYLFGLGSVATLTALVLTLIDGWRTAWQSVVTNNLHYYPIMGSGWTDFTGQLMQLMVMLILCFSLPLVLRLITPQYRLQIISPQHRPTYYLIGLSHIALLASTLYFFEQVHVLQIIGFGLILFSWTIFLLAKRIWLLFDMKHWVAYGMTMGAFLFVCSVTVWEIGHLYNLAQMFGVLSPKKYQVSYQTQRGTIFNNPRWARSIGKELPIMHQLLTSALTGQRIFFLPFTPGYYYFYDYTNPTAYDILPSEKLPPGEMDRLRSTLTSSVDVIVYVPYSWLDLSPQKDIMQWIQREYPEKLEIMKGRIILYAKKPFDASVTRFVQ